MGERSETGHRRHELTGSYRQRHRERPRQGAAECCWSSTGRGHADHRELPPRRPAHVRAHGLLHLTSI